MLSKATTGNTAQEVKDSGIFQLSELAISPELRRELQQIVASKPYPLLIIGEEGAGKHTIANCLAASFLCDLVKNDGSACGACTSCRMLASGGHLDLVILDPGPSGRCKVDEVRAEVAARLFEAPRISRNKVFIISAEKADTLSEACQNALLKPLEEHPPFARFIIYCEDSDRLLPTIRSRVQMLRLGHRNREEIRQILDEAGIEDPAAKKFALDCSDGLAGVALTLAQDDKYRQVYNDSLDLFKALPVKKRTFFLTSGLEFFKANKESTAMIIRLFQSFLRELSVALLTTNREQYQTDSAVFFDKELEAWSQLNVDYEGLLELLSETKRALSSNTNYDHTISRLLLQMITKMGNCL
ncbi:MAG: hypothetical protein PHV73_06460 [Eubacteriales bacterium]|nr:hypothetical protein [Eubacteriales bacterium]